ncbi:hypothetical protein HUW46_06241 [Amycolatopsis sp. CA-230715]|nr:hypothetical protein HUW46_06241 [Amycolatopsis sp. CA-230715]
MLMLNRPVIDDSNNRRPTWFRTNSGKVVLFR